MPILSCGSAATAVASDMRTRAMARRVFMAGFDRSDKLPACRRRREGWELASWQLAARVQCPRYRAELQAAAASVVNARP
jgi:hypothetical protein